jgi:hypothetical protein
VPLILPHGCFHGFFFLFANCSHGMSSCQNALFRIITSPATLHPLACNLQSTEPCCKNLLEIKLAVKIKHLASSRPRGQNSCCNQNSENISSTD